MKKVLLVRPEPPKETIGLKHVMICEPLELEYLLANLDTELKNTYKLEIVDMLIDARSIEFHIEKNEPSVVVFTGYNTHVNIIKKLASQVKSIDSEIIIAVGGVHVEVVPEDFNHNSIDCLLSKNGIDAFNIMLKGLKKAQAPEMIQEAIDRQVFKAEFDYKFPDRKANLDHRNKYYYMFHNPCALMKTSYGCQFKCSFCFCHEVTQGHYYERSIDNVIEELKGISEDEIYIVDDNFLFSRKRVETFIEGLKAGQIKKQYLIYGRADFIAKNPDLMAEFKSVGLHGVIVGLESVRESDLESYEKKTSVAMNEKAVAILKSLDIECYGTLIIPLDFDRKDFRDLKQWLRKVDLNFVNLQPLTPLKGTGIYEDYLGDLIEDPEDIELFDMAHIVLKPKHMSKRKFYWQIIKLYYQIVMYPKHTIRLIKKYGLRANLKMLIGSSRVSGQYLLKMMRG